MEAESAVNRLGERLRLILKYRGQSLRHFSEVTGIPYRTLQDNIAGKSKPNADQLKKMADMNININYLLNGSVLGFQPGSFDVDRSYSAEEVLGDEKLVQELEDRALNFFIEHDFSVREREALFEKYREILHRHLQAAISLSDVVWSMRKTTTETSRIADIIAQNARGELQFYEFKSVKGAAPAVTRHRSGRAAKADAASDGDNEA